MNSNLHEWLNLLIRWGHFLAGIMWIGTSLYFVWMDSSFKPLAEPKKGVDGEVWMVHGGNFYHVEKRRFGPGEMPSLLHWFKWEATLTWLTGFMLLIVVYYMTSGAYLVDAQVKNLSPGLASLIGLGVIFGGWIFYDLLLRSPLAKSKWVNVVGLFLTAAIIYFLTHTFSGRGAFIHLGAMFGTMMVLNVWVHILPNQQAIIEASNAGNEPNYDLGKIAKTRSMHNSYMTLPVLFIMISNHFPSTFAHSNNWLVLILIVLMGALVRHVMISAKYWPLAPALACLVALVSMTYVKAARGLPENDSENSKVHFFQINHILQNRCVQCHSRFPTDSVFTVAPGGVVFDTPADIQQWSTRINERAVQQKTMPLANKTQMLDEERILLGKWISQGARVE